MLYKTTIIKAVKLKKKELGVKDDIKSTDMGVSFGGGVGIAMGSAGILSLEGRYTMGLTSISEGTDEDAKNKGISIMAGYAFPLGK